MYHYKPGQTHNPEIAEGQALPVKAETITGTSDLEGGGGGVGHYPDFSRS